MVEKFMTFKSNIGAIGGESVIDINNKISGTKDFICIQMV